MAAGTSEEQIRPASRTSEVCRFDLLQEVISIDEDTGIVLMHMRPDPRRYSEFEEDGETWFLDKYFNTAFRLKDIADAPTDGLPIYASGRTVSSATEYASERRAAVENELETGQYTPPTQAARPHEPLSASDERDIAFISVDVCGSTPYR